LKAHDRVLGDGAEIFSELDLLLRKFTAAGWAVLARRPSGPLTSQAALLLTTVQQIALGLKLEHSPQDASKVVLAPEDGSAPASKLLSGMEFEMPNPVHCLADLTGIVDAVTHVWEARLQAKVDCIASQRFDAAGCAGDITYAVRELSKIVGHMASASFDCMNEALTCTHCAGSLLVHLAEAARSSFSVHSICHSDRDAPNEKLACSSDAVQVVDGLKQTLHWAGTAREVCPISSDGDGPSGWWGNYSATWRAWSSGMFEDAGNTAPEGAVRLSSTATTALREIAGALVAGTSGGGAAAGANMTQLLAAVADVTKDVSSALHELDMKVKGIPAGGSEPSSFADHLRRYSSRLPSALAVSASLAALLFEHGSASALQSGGQAEFVLIP